MFGDGSAKHFFCGACGVHTFSAPQYADGGEGDGGGDGPVQVRAGIRVARRENNHELYKLWLNLHSIHSISSWICSIC
jgi:hypothetical protein